jgi:predicted ester cyclase
MSRYNYVYQEVMMATPRNVVQMQYDDFNNRTYRQNAASYVAPNAVFVDAPTGQEGHGVAGFIENADMWVGAFSDAQAEVIAMETQGNTVFTRFIARGTFDGILPAPDGSMIEGNGQRLEMEFTSETEVADGKIVHDVTEYDLQEMMRQLGLA